MTSTFFICVIDCLAENGVLKGNGQTWNKGCSTCTCNNGKITCEPKTCDCNAIKSINYIQDNTTLNVDEDEFNTKCCSKCFENEEVNVPCTNADGVRKHATGETWLHNCQQCECKVSVNKTKYYVNEIIISISNFIHHLLLLLNILLAIINFVER